MGKTQTTAVENGFLQCLTHGGETGLHAMGPALKRSLENTLSVQRKMNSSGNSINLKREGGGSSGQSTDLNCYRCHPFGA